MGVWFTFWFTWFTCSFTTKAQRELFRIKAEALGVKSELHYLNVPLDLRKDRVKQRNISKDPELYAFEVTEMMFNFMEPRFETPDDTELENGCTIAVK
jgi:predicted kinase